jgi:hypothetical protein
MLFDCQVFECYATKFESHGKEGGSRKMLEKREFCGGFEGRS